MQNKKKTGHETGPAPHPSGKLQTREASAGPRPGTTASLTVEDPEHLRLLQGANHRFLRRVRDAFGLRASARGGRITLEGDPEKVQRGMRVMRNLLEIVRRHHRLAEDDVSRVLHEVREERAQALPGPVDDAVAFELVGGRSVVARTRGQSLYVQALRHHDIVFGVGPAGTGKTYLAVASALSTLDAGEVNRIILVRPAVEAGEKLGFLPGDFREKVNPYLRPLYDALQDMLPFGQLERHLERGLIEVAPLAYMRGRTLNRAFAILDEAQNTTSKQMKMFLTRLGRHAQAVITGDTTQVDLAAGDESGLSHAVRILTGIEGIAVVKLGREDIVRHRLVRDIVAAYERDDSTREPRVARPESPEAQGLPGTT